MNLKTRYLLLCFPIIQVIASNAQLAVIKVSDSVRENKAQTIDDRLGQAINAKFFQQDAFISVCK